MTFNENIKINYGKHKQQKRGQKKIKRNTKLNVIKSRKIKGKFYMQTKSKIIIIKFYYIGVVFSYLLNFR